MSVTYRQLRTGMHLTEEEYDRLVTEDDRSELVDGVVYVPSPASSVHSDIQTFLVTVLRLVAERTGAGIVYGDNRELRLGSQRRVPDALFVAKEHRDRDHHSHIEGPPDLVIEIVSPDSRERDLVQKYEAYQRHGVPEYWAVDPEELALRAYHLSASGVYEPIPPGPDGAIRSIVLPAFWLKPEWLWPEKSSPSALVALREMGLIS